MSWTRFAATVSAAVLAGWAASASAADYDYGRSGPYLGGGASYAIENFSSSVVTFDHDTTVNAGHHPTPDNSWGYNLKGGYRFNEYFAVEADWDHLVDFHSTEGSIKEWMIGANGKLYPFHGMVQPFVSAGVGWTNINDSRTQPAKYKLDPVGVGVRFGGGLEIYLTRNWALTAEATYIMPVKSRAGFDTIPVTLGFLYRFY